MKRKTKTRIKYSLALVAASIALIGWDVAVQAQDKKSNTATTTANGGTGPAASAPTKEKQAAVTPQINLDFSGRFAGSRALYPRCGTPVRK